MATTLRSLLESIRHTVRARIFSGLLVIVPVGVTLMVLNFLFNATFGALLPIVRGLFLDMPPYLVTILSIILIICVVYLVGIFASMVVGRRLLNLGEKLVGRIPVVKTVYSVSKQVIELFESPVDTDRRQAVMVEFPGPGLRAVGFITGRMTLPDGTECYTVFIPTTPNPTTGFLEVVPIDKSMPLDMTGEEAIRFIMSGGLLAPARVAASKQTPGIPAE